MARVSPRCSCGHSKSTHELRVGRCIAFRCPCAAYVPESPAADSATPAPRPPRTAAEASALRAIREAETSAADLLRDEVGTSDARRDPQPARTGGSDA